MKPWKYGKQYVSKLYSVLSIQIGTNFCFLFIVESCYKAWKEQKKSVKIENCNFNELRSTFSFSQNGKPDLLF